MSTDSNSFRDILRSTILDIEMDPDMSNRSEGYVLTYLDGDNDHDLIFLF